MKRENENLKETEKVQKEELEELKSELESVKNALKSNDSDQRITELEATKSSLQETIQGQKLKIEDLKSLLDEAALDYNSKDKEISTLNKTVLDLKVSSYYFPHLVKIRCANTFLFLQKTIGDKEETIEEIKTKENELRVLLTASNTRMEEIELQVFEQEERVEKLTTELESVTKGKSATI